MKTSRDSATGGLTSTRLDGLGTWRERATGEGVRDRVQAVVAAYESGLVRPGAAG